MSDPGFARPDLCSIALLTSRTSLPKQSAAGSAPTAAHWPMISRPYPWRPASTAPSACPPRQPCSPWRASRRTSPTGTPTRSSGPAARPGSPPGSRATIDGLVYASSMVVLYAARHRVPVPYLARWLLALGIAATLTANMAPGWSHGPVGAVVAASQAVSLVGSYELLVWLIRTSGAADRGRPQRASALARPAVLRGVLSRPQPLTASAPEGTSATRQAWRGGPRVSRRAVGVPAGGSVTMRRLRPALSMTRRWPRTGSASRPATRFRNAGSPRCSDAHPAAGREPESPMHDRNRRSQTRRAPRSRLTRKQGPPAVSPDAI